MNSKKNIYFRFTIKGLQSMYLKNNVLTRNVSLRNHASLLLQYNVAVGHETCSFYFKTPKMMSFYSQKHKTKRGTKNNNKGVLVTGDLKLERDIFSLKLIEITKLLEVVKFFLCQYMPSLPLPNFKSMCFAVRKQY